MKTCLECEFFKYETGDGGYSDVTPGWDAVIMCNKLHWELEMLKDTPEEYMKKMMTAKTCTDFEESKLVKQIKLYNLSRSKEMPKLNFVKKARNDRRFGIKKGESYYWWKFNFGARHESKTKPPRSALTQSSFYSQLWGIQDSTAKFEAEHISDEVENMVESINNLRDECQESLDNMPEHLQDSSSSGELLTERIEQLEEYANNLEAIDLEFDAQFITDGADKAERFEEMIKEINDYDPEL